MKLYLLRCDECGAEATSEKHAGPCPGCGEMRDVYLCVCGCGVDLCIPCLDAMQSLPHHWRVVAEVDPAEDFPAAKNFPAAEDFRGPNAKWFGEEAARLESVALTKVFSKGELASLYAAAKSMAAIIESSASATPQRGEIYADLLSGTNKLVGAINLNVQEAA